MAAFAALAELLSSDESTSSSSSSSSDDEDFEERQALCEAFFRETFSESHRERPKILGFIENVARLYTDEQFRQDFRVSRRVAETLIRGFEGSRHYPCSDRGGSPLENRGRAHSGLSVVCCKQGEILISCQRTSNKCQEHNRMMFPPNNGPLASTEDALRRQGEEKRERLMQAMRI
ncbi:hypothetical protein MRX96_058404 [Rhipicephalus microplus]